MASANTMGKCVALILSLLVPVAVMAADLGGAVTSSSGVVSLNGVRIRGAHALSPGDLIRTAEGRVSVRMPGGTVAITENSDVRFDSSTVQLRQGFAQVTGTRGLTAKYRDLTVHAVGSETATFVVGELDGKPTVATLKGAILVSDGEGSVILPAGRAMEPALPEGSQPTPVATIQEGQAPEPAVKGGHPSKEDQERGGKKNRRVLAGWVETAIIAGIIGGILGGLAASGTFSKPVSSQTVQGPQVP